LLQDFCHKLDPEKVALGRVSQCANDGMLLFVTPIEEMLAFVKSVLGNVFKVIVCMISSHWKHLRLNLRQVGRIAGKNDCLETSVLGSKFSNPVAHADSILVTASIVKTINDNDRVFSFAVLESNVNRVPKFVLEGNGIRRTERIVVCLLQRVQEVGVANVYAEKLSREIFCESYRSAFLRKVGFYSKD